MRRKIRIALALAVLGLFAAGGVYYWWHEYRYPSTENAYVGGNVIRVAPLVSGKVISLHILDNQYVRAGQPLLVVDKEAYQLAVVEARTAFDNAAETAGVSADDVKKAVEAIDDATRTHDEAMDAYSFAASRYNSLVSIASGLETASDDLDKALNEVKSRQRELDDAMDALEDARANITKTGAQNIALRTATAKLQRTLLERLRTTIRASKGGWISNLEIRPGAVIKTGQPLFALVEDSDRWVDANFKETDLNRLRVGQPVKIKIDMYPDLELNGKIESFSGGSGAVFSTLPPENATGNWVKITQRFTVRISVDDFPYARSRPLRIGSSAAVTVDTTGVDEE